MERLNIMVARHSAFYSPLIAAIAAGFLRDAGFEVSYSAMTAQKSVPDGLRDGSVQVGQLSVSVSWPQMEQGKENDLLHFAQINERDGFFIAAREPDPDFDWRKLAGSEVLVDHFQQPLAMFKYAVHRMGVDYGAIDAIDAGDVDAIIQAFRDGRGEYVHLQGPAPQQLEHDGVGHVVAAVGDAIGPVAFSTLVSTRQWLDTDAARAFMGAYRQARRWVNDTPAAEIAAAEAEYFPGVDQAVLASTIATYQGLGCWHPDPRIQPAHYEVALDVFAHSGLISRRHPFEQVVVLPPDEA